MLHILIDWRVLLVISSTRLVVSSHENLCNMTLSRDRRDNLELNRSELANRLRLDTEVWNELRVKKVVTEAVKQGIEVSKSYYGTPIFVMIL